MIKLRNILSEIRIIRGSNKIDGGDVHKLWIKICKSFNNDIAHKKALEIINHYGRDKHLGTNLINWFYSLDQNALKHIHSVFSNLLKDKIHEIKLTNPNQITPEIVNKLWDKLIEDDILQLIPGDYFNNKQNVFNKWSEFQKKYFGPNCPNLSANADTLSFYWLKSLSKDELIKVYLEFQRLYKTYKPINEIKIIPNATPEKVKELNDQLWNLFVGRRIYGNEGFNDFVEARPSDYGNYSLDFNKESLKYWDKDKLRDAYVRFLNLKKKYNIK